MAEDRLNPIDTFIQYNGQTLPIQVHARDYIGAVICQTHSFFESEILEFIRANFPTQRTVIDVGANIGNHSLFFATVVKPERLVCFEPFPPNCELLTANLRRTEIHPEIHPCGLGEAEATVGMRFHPENLGICRLDGAVPGQIPVKTLDSFQIENVTLLKIDVEGDDINVLRGAFQTIRQSRPVILIEGVFDEIFPILAPFGYVCIAYWKPYQTYCFVRLLQGTL